MEKYSWGTKRNQPKEKREDTNHLIFMKIQKILIVEDETIIALHLKNLIKRLGKYECASVSSGEHAIELSKTFEPDLIFMDINLSGQIDGIEAARQIRTKNDVPVVFVSAYTDEDTIEEAKLTNPAGYLTKPIYAHTVEKTLTELLQKDEHFSASYEVQNASTKEYGGILETQIMALPRFVLHPEE